MEKDNQVVYELYRDGKMMIRGTAKEIAKTKIVSQSFCYNNPTCQPVAIRKNIYTVYDNDVECFKGSKEEVSETFHYSLARVRSCIQRNEKMGKRYTIKYAEQREISFNEFNLRKEKDIGQRF